MCRHVCAILLQSSSSSRSCTGLTLIAAASPPATCVSCNPIRSIYLRLLFLSFPALDVASSLSHGYTSSDSISLPHTHMLSLLLSHRKASRKLRPLNFISLPFSFSFLVSRLSSRAPADGVCRCRVCVDRQAVDAQACSLPLSLLVTPSSLACLWLRDLFRLLPHPPSLAFAPPFLSFCLSLSLSSPFYASSSCVPRLPLASRSASLALSCSSRMTREKEGENERRRCTCARTGGERR